MDRTYQRNTTVNYNLTEMADNNNTTTQKSNLKKAALRSTMVLVKIECIIKYYPFECTSI